MITVAAFDSPASSLMTAGSGSHFSTSFTTGLEASGSGEDATEIKGGEETAGAADDTDDEDAKAADLRVTAVGVFLEDFNTAGNTAGDTAGNTAGNTAGDTAGDTAGNTAGDTASALGGEGLTITATGCGGSITGGEAITGDVTGWGGSPAGIVTGWGGSPVGIGVWH